MAQREVVFIDGMRTPFGRMGGAMRMLVFANWQYCPERIGRENQDCGKSQRGLCFCGVSRPLCTDYKPRSMDQSCRRITQRDIGIASVEMQCGSAI